LFSLDLCLLFTVYFLLVLFVAYNDYKSFNEFKSKSRSKSLSIIIFISVSDVDDAGNDAIDDDADDDDDDANENDDGAVVTVACVGANIGEVEGELLK
jgi:hypothetical protein